MVLMIPPMTEIGKPFIPMLSKIIIRKAGDYDFNDIVLNVTLPVAGNEVKELKYKIDLRAVGAVKQLGAGLRIRGIEKIM